MGVYIKGMKMPTSCWDCEVGGAKQMDNATCPFYSMEYWEQENYQDKIADGCPLVPVPPHGRLIDADELWMEINKICDRRDAGIITDLTCLQQLLSAVRHAPTILQADDPKLSATIKCGGVVTCKEYVDTAGELRWTVTHSGKQQPGRGG